MVKKEEEEEFVTMVINKALEIKIPFLAVFRNLLVVFPMALNNY